MTTAKQLADAITVIYDYVNETGADVNIESGTIQIHWNGVNRVECGPTDAAKVLTLLKQLESLGMKDC